MCTHLLGCPSNWTGSKQPFPLNHLMRPLKIMFLRNSHPFVSVWNKAFPREIQHTCLLSPHQKPTTDQSTGNTKNQLGKSISFTGVAYKSMGEGSPTQVWVTAREAGGLEHTAQLAGSSTGYKGPFPGASVCVSLFRAALLIAAAWELIWFDSLYSLALFSLRKN